jgi:coatomer protein complex subunit gamma
LDNLDAALASYLEAGEQKPFDISSVSLERIIPVAKTTEKAVVSASSKTNASPALDLSNVLASSGADQSQQGGSKSLQATPAAKMVELFPDLGPLFKTSPPQPLTEPETEYQVVVFRHVFPQVPAVVLQFNVVNTLADQALSNISFDLKPTESSRAMARKLKIARRVPHQGLLLAHGRPEVSLATSYIVIQLHEDLRSQALPIPPVSFSCTMKFDALNVIDEAAEEVDEGSAFSDEYPLDQLDLANADNVKRVSIANWTNAWESMNPVEPEEGQAGWFQGIVTFSLANTNSLSDAVRDIIQILGMQPCDGTEEVPPKRPKHVLQLVGVHISGARLTARARMKLNAPAPGVAVELCVRSPSQLISDTLASVVMSQ